MNSGCLLLSEVNSSLHSTNVIKQISIDYSEIFNILIFRNLQFSVLTCEWNPFVAMWPFAVTQSAVSVLRFFRTHL